MVNIKTHRNVSKKYVGEVVELGNDRAVAELDISEEMVVDEKGLVHGGFIFGLADYAAMMAVNENTVVLSNAESEFIEPVKIGERLRAEAEVREKGGSKFIVDCRAWKKSSKEVVFRGSFECSVPNKHVLD